MWASAVRHASDARLSLAAGGGRGRAGSGVAMARSRSRTGVKARLVKVVALNNTCSRGRTPEKERKIARRCRCQSGSSGSGRGCGNRLCDSPWHQCDSPRGQSYQHRILTHASLSLFLKERHCRSPAIGEPCWLALIALCGISSPHLDPGPNRSVALIVAGK